VSNVYVLAKIKKKYWSRGGICTSQEVPVWWNRRIFVNRDSCIIRRCWWWFCQVFLLSVID